MKRKSYVFLSLIILISMLVMFSGCAQQAATQQTTVKNETQQSTTASGGEKLKFAMIVHTIDSFTTSFKKGAENAAAAFNIELDYMAPNSIDIPKQVAMLETAVESGNYDGIATTVMDDNAYSAAIKAAQEKGIPIIVFNMDSSVAPLGDAFVGQDFVAAGYQLGKNMFEKMGGKGKYLLVSAIPTLDCLVKRAEGIKKAAAEYPGIELAAPMVDVGTDMTKAVAAIENAYSANPDINCILSTDQFGEAIGMFMAADNLKGKIMAGCFDVTPGIMNYIKQGVMQVTVGQNPFYQGFYPVQLLYHKLTLGITPITIDTGAVVVDSSNVDKFITSGGE